MAPQHITFEDVRIGFRNFSGKEGKYNREGDRNFVLFLDDRALADQMAKDGWNIKELQPRDDQEDPQPYVQVSVNYRGRPPRVVLITSKGKTQLDEDSVNILDWADIETVDLIVNPYEWEVSGKSGVKAYLKSIFVTIREDELDRKYLDVPDSAANSAVPDAVGNEDAPF